MGNNPIVFFDKLNHASLYQAVFLSRAKLIRYWYHNMDLLNYLLIKFKDDSRPKFIVTETIFGMDGDIVSVKAFLYLDEAHATGIISHN
ncbi:MAG: aminotransferase class I/II-fold pyridoxal phosphate-dependent enzyme [Wolbachia sp.]|nr:aminotransferase class I/II-fold pyridoxal phosphate-dependent enzyme [Wolbachia sp.]MDD9336755.1 aminotransferase class I/II-fold pyridoxal phosphate-dependent enzyme [Wolbachia sp.]